MGSCSSRLPRTAPRCPPDGSWTGCFVVCPSRSGKRRCSTRSRTAAGRPRRSSTSLCPALNPGAARTAPAWPTPRGRPWWTAKPGTWNACLPGPTGYTSIRCGTSEPGGRWSTRRVPAASGTGSGRPGSGARGTSRAPSSGSATTKSFPGIGDPSDGPATRSRPGWATSSPSRRASACGATGREPCTRPSGSAPWFRFTRRGPRFISFEPCDPGGPPRSKH